MTERVAFYPGSFDPVTNGHLDILRQCSSLYDKLVVGVGVHAGKKPLFTFQERADIIRSVLKFLPWDSDSIEVVAFDTLAVEAAQKHGASVILRGLRDGSDLDYEMRMAGMNNSLAPDVTTLFLPARPEVRPITATLVRQIASMGGSVSPFVPRAVEHALKAKLSKD